MDDRIDDYTGADSPYYHHDHEAPHQYDSFNYIAPMSDGFDLPSLDSDDFNQAGPSSPSPLGSYENKAQMRHGLCFNSPARMEPYAYGYDEVYYHQQEPQGIDPVAMHPYRDQRNIVRVSGDQADYCQPVAGVSNSPRTTTGIRLRPVSDLPDIFRGIFKFGAFNAVQSSCFDMIIGGNENLVITAPTGSGKTALFELAIIRMIMNQREGFDQRSKCVYVAPTKALCSERSRDWAIKFDPLGFKCCEFTGDTVQTGKNAWGDIKSASIIVTTGEKWDSLTRNWQDHEKVLSQIHLFLVDEVHVLNETRGSTLEVIISRMKARGIAVRFILLSATVPNAADIAEWIGSTQGSTNTAAVYEFGEEFRPCVLKRIVQGFPRHKDAHDFAFARFLDTKLFSALQKHSVKKPILVFSPTRKGVFTTAERLKKDYEEAEQHKDSLPWQRPASIDHTFHDKRLIPLATCGIGIHHAGLIYEDRRAVEDLYLKKILRVIVCTSTLAVGVNLPAHLVVIHGVHTFQNNASVEYSDLDVMQMLGRAGRPQFDRDGIALILCEKELEGKYDALVQGVTTLESTLHLNLSEHLNSEIALGTITNTTSAKNWLRETFLFQRIKKNPQHYSLNKDETQTWEERMDNLVMQSLRALKETQLVEGPGVDIGEGDLRATEFGDVMSRLYIRQATMSLILSLPEKPVMRVMLETLSQAEELSISSLRSSEKQVLNKLRRNNDIRYEVQKVERIADKVFLLIQAVLGGISLSSAEFKSGDSQLQLEAVGIFKHVTRIARAIIDVGAIKRQGGQIQCGLELLRCLNAKAWEDRHIVLRQIEQIGEKSLKVLAEHGITSLSLLRKQVPLRLEVLLNRRPPFGQDVLASVADIPQYAIQIEVVDTIVLGKGQPVEIKLSIECQLLANTGRPKKAKSQGYNMTTILTMTSESCLVDFRRTPTKLLQTARRFQCSAKLHKPSEHLIVQISSETHAGTLVSQVYKPDISPSLFPIPDTRPPSSVEIDLQGLEDDPEFWIMDIESDGNESGGLREGEVGIVRSSVPAHPGHQKVQIREISCSKKNDQDKLPNGRLKCHHSCKDKTKCRHNCCHDGVIEHSKKQKNKTAGNAVRTEGQVLQALESIHQSSGVIDSLKMTSGQRLKLPTKERKRERPNFEITFEPSPGGCIDDNTQISDSELPEPHNIMTTATETTRAASPRISAAGAPIGDQQRPAKRMRFQEYTDVRALEPDLPVASNAASLGNTPSFLPDSDPPATTFDDDAHILAAFVSNHFNDRKAPGTQPATRIRVEAVNQLEELEKWLEHGDVDVV